MTAVVRAQVRTRDVKPGIINKKDIWREEWLSGIPGSDVDIVVYGFMYFTAQCLYVLYSAVSLCTLQRSVYSTYYPGPFLTLASLCLLLR